MNQTTIQPIVHPLLESNGIAHGFFTRQGGVSTGVYDSLNCGPGSDDDPAAVQENRRRVGAWLTGRDIAPLTAYQVHSPRAVIVDGPWRGKPPDADAIVTKTAGVVIAALAADCAPVLLADKDAGVVAAAAHAGWRGAVGRCGGCGCRCDGEHRCRSKPHSRRGWPLHRPAVLRGGQGLRDPIPGG